MAFRLLEELPLRGDPASLFQALKCGIESAMLGEQFFYSCCPDGTCDRFSVLRSKDGRTEDQLIQCALSQVQSF
jgi:hypothetical protein